MALTLPTLSGMACGGDDGGGALSKAEFIKQGDDICQKLNDQSDKVNPQGEDLNALVTFLEKIIVLIEGAHSDFAALDAPDDAGEVKKTMLSSLQDGIDASRDAQDAAKKNDSEGVTAALKDIEAAGESIKTSTGKYGFKVCSESS
jgi:hypothetical protein